MAFGGRGQWRPPTREMTKLIPERQAGVSQVKWGRNGFCSRESQMWRHSAKGRAGSSQGVGHRAQSLENRLSSVQLSRSVVSDSLRPRELQHARPPCSSPTPGVHPNPRALSRWCHPAISSSVVHFSSCLQSFPASGSFQMSQLFAWGGQSIGVSASTSVVPLITQDWSPLGWTGWISLQSKGLSRVFFNTIVQKHRFFGAQLSL